MSNPLSSQSCRISTRGHLIRRLGLCKQECQGEHVPGHAEPERSGRYLRHLSCYQVPGDMPDGPPSQRHWQQPGTSAHRKERLQQQGLCASRFASREEGTHAASGELNSDIEADSAELRAAFAGDFIRAPQRLRDPIDPHILHQAVERGLHIVLDDVGQRAGR